MLLFADVELQWRWWNVNGGRREGEECAGLNNYFPFAIFITLWGKYSPPHFIPQPIST